MRAGMESSFGHDFSSVRVHSGDEASLMAQRMQARAYTVGHDVVLGRPGEAVTGDAGRRLLAHELAHVVQYDLSGRAVLARQTPPAAPPPVAAAIQYEETPLPGGRVRIRAWGRVGDPIPRSGYEGKWPGPGEVGLAGMDRWHLAGPEATGGEIGIAYTPKNFNIGRTATVENVLRNARGYMRAVGGDVYFDFTADCRIVGEYEGVSIRVVEDVHWQIDGRLFGGGNIIQILDEHAVVPAMPPVTPAAPTPSPAQSMQGPGTAGPKPTSTTPTPKSPAAPEGGGGEISTLEPTGGPSGAAVPTPAEATPIAPVEEPVVPGPAVSGTGMIVTTVAVVGAELVIHHLAGKLGGIERENIRRGWRAAVVPKFAGTIESLHRGWRYNPKTRPTEQTYLVVEYGISFEEQPYSRFIWGGPVYLYKQMDYLRSHISTTLLNERLDPPYDPSNDQSYNFPTRQVFAVSIPVWPERPVATGGSGQRIPIATGGSGQRIPIATGPLRPNE